MGLSVYNSRCTCSCKDTPNVKLPNPNPKHFIINEIEEIGNFVVTMITYPDCTNYEGKKILVFEGVDVIDVTCAKEIDPHFCDGNHLSPIARFEPTDKGLMMAIRFCESLKK